MIEKEALMVFRPDAVQEIDFMFGDGEAETFTPMMWPLAFALGVNAAAKAWAISKGAYPPISAMGISGGNSGGGDGDDTDDGSEGPCNVGCEFIDNECVC